MAPEISIIQVLRLCVCFCLCFQISLIGVFTSASKNVAVSHGSRCFIHVSYNGHVILLAIVNGSIPSLNLLLLFQTAHFAPFQVILQTHKELNDTSAMTILCHSNGIAEILNIGLVYTLAPISICY